MTNLERMQKGLLYIADDELMAIQARARKLTQQINTMDRSDFDGIDALIKELFAQSEDAHVNPPFYCDYGKNIYVGKNFFANYNCVILDVGKVIIGDNCLLAPNVSIYTAGHPVHPAARNTFYEYGIDVKVENGTWAETYDVLIKEIKSCTDDANRYAMMHDAEDMLMASGCLTPIYYYTDMYMLDKNVKGFFSNPLGYKYFMYCTFED